jgi:predicted regulator of Ras-like GTPase activity (Roadblock/LC7/MglB family)
MSAVHTCTPGTGTTTDPARAATGPGTLPTPGAALGAAEAAAGAGQALGMSHEARNLQWLLENFVEEVPGARSVAVVSSDGLLLLSSASGPSSVPAPGPDGSTPRPVEARMDLAAVVSGLASLTVGAARLMDGGRVRQTTVAMDGGMLVVMSISDGSLLGVHTSAECDISVVAYHMALFVGRAGHVLTPALRGELRQAMETAG